MLQAWRIVQPRWADRAFTGEGARRFGGRWNSKGTPAIYLAGNKSLAVLEILVHLGSAAAAIRFQTFCVAIDPEWIERIDVNQLPAGWNAPSLTDATQSIGDRWASEQRSLVLEVASAIIPEEPNYMVNPHHPSFPSMRIERGSPFCMDPRLMRPVD